MFIIWNPAFKNFWKGYEIQPKQISEWSKDIWKAKQLDSLDEAKQVAKNYLRLGSRLIVFEIKEVTDEF